MARYIRAESVLPASLLAEIQRYVEGVQLYVPCRGERAAWGEKSGARVDYARRNRELCEQYARGASIRELMDRYCLSYDAVRKILRRGCGTVGSRAGG